jgi:hypothetical protein
MRSRNFVFSVACLFALAGCVSSDKVRKGTDNTLVAAEQSELQTQAKELTRVNSGSKIALQVCVDYGCDRKRTALVSEAEWHKIEGILSKADSPESERIAAAEAVGFIEQIVGPQVGTDRDLTRNTEPDGGPGHLDCIAESMNTDLYLRRLSQAALMRWHQVEPRSHRAPWIFNLHWTAVLRQTGSGQLFAVDSWYGANGQRSYVVELEKWLWGASPRTPN